MTSDAPAGSLGRALLVHEVREDSSDARLSASAARSAGFELIEAANDRDALHALESDRIDLVLCDIPMPTNNGSALLRSIRARWGVPIVVLSAAADQSRAAVQAAELGAAQYLVKPIDPAALERMLELAVRPRRPGRTQPAVFYNRRGEKVVPAVFTATDTKKEFGRALDIAMQGGLVVVTKHDDAKAVMLSVEEFNELVEPAARRLDDLRREFDVLLADMQKPAAKTAMKAAFGASPEALGKAAVFAATKRG